MLLIFKYTSCILNYSMYKGYFSKINNYIHSFNVTFDILYSLILK